MNIDVNMSANNGVTSVKINQGLACRFWSSNGCAGNNMIISPSSTFFYSPYIDFGFYQVEADFSSRLDNALRTMSATLPTPAKSTDFFS